jgi:CRISPR-associated protein Cas1
MLSKRANVFYLEHARVIKKDERVMYLTQSGGEVERFFNIPERNTAFLLLGKGTSITDAAARRLAESNVVVGFCGSGGTPLFGSVDIAFLTPQSEYRPTEYMQKWIAIWSDERKRLSLGKRLLHERLRLAADRWSRNGELIGKGIVIPPSLADTFRGSIEAAVRTEQLLSAEAAWAKALYGLLARGYSIAFTRQEGEGRGESVADRANSFLDHGNYLAYGFASTALCGLGISFSLPILHGKTRRGALVFDIADLIKDAYVMPRAFLSAKAGEPESVFRDGLIEIFQADEALDFLFTFIQSACEEIK